MKTTDTEDAAAYIDHYATVAAGVTVLRGLHESR